MKNLILTLFLMVIGNFAFAISLDGVDSNPSIFIGYNECKELSSLELFSNVEYLNEINQNSDVDENNFTKTKMENVPLPFFGFICYVEVSNGGVVSGSGIGFSQTSFQDACNNAYANAMDNLQADISVD